MHTDQPVQASRTSHHSIPQSSNYHNPRLRKRRRLKILNKYPFKNSSVRVAAETYHRREIFISARNLTKWFDDQRSQTQRSGSTTNGSQFMNFRIRFKISAEFPVLDLLVRLLIPFHCLFAFVICSAIASRQTRLSGFADSFKNK